MFEEFSGGYYLGRLYVRPSDVERAQMHRDQHERLNEELYAAGEGVERLDAPLVMKLDNAHFPVHGDEAVPADTLAVPDELVEDDREHGPTMREVFVAKADRARQLLRLAGAYGPPDAT
jgi:hypothetical protein